MNLELSLLLLLPFVYCQNFNKQYVGVAFGPYTKYGNALWNSYSTEEIERMLSVVSSKFLHISTYGMGVNQWNYNHAWDKSDSSCLIARAAANLNNQKRSTVVDVAIGIYQSETQNYQNAEVNNAFSAAIDANHRHPGTVWGLIFTNEYFDNQHVDRAKKVLGMIQYDKARAIKNGLKVGTRSHVCGEILNKYSNLYNVLRDIAGASDFIMCNMYPNVVNQGAQKAVDAIGNFYLAVRKAFLAVNKNISVIIGETGWPDAGQTYNQSPNNIQNLKMFWEAMGDWAARNAVRTYMFEAMDEPYKRGISSESHYGWWKRRDDNSEVYIEKVSNRQIGGK